MQGEKINSRSMKASNMRFVMNMVRSAGYISRNDLARKIGLTSATITNIVGELIEKRYIVEVGEVTSSNCGRRPVMLCVNPKVCYIVGIDVSASRVAGVLTDFMANILARVVVRIDSSIRPDELVGAILGVIDGVIADSGVSRGDVKCIGLVVPGPDDIAKGVMIAPNNLPNIKNLPIRDIIAQKTGISVTFEHHMAAAGFGEYWLGDAGDSKCMLLCSVLEIGIAGSILIDGKILHGFRDISGEIGHMVIDRNGPKCSCGDYGCLEALAEGRALVNAVKRSLKQNAAVREACGISDVDEIDLDYVIEAARQGKEPFSSRLKKCAEYLAMALWNVIVTVSPDTIVLSGKLPCMSDMYVDQVKSFLRAKPNPRYSDEIRVYPTRLKQNIFPMGAVALAMNDIFNNLY